jgi:hypothetical protein
MAAISSGHTAFTCEHYGTGHAKLQVSECLPNDGSRIAFGLSLSYN